MNLHSRVKKLEQSSAGAGRIVVMWGALGENCLEDRIVAKRKSGEIRSNDTIIVTGVPRAGDE